MKIQVYGAAVLAVASIGAASAQDAGVVEVQGRRSDNGEGLNAVSGSASRLGLSVRETPASVEVLTQDTIQERGNRTVLDALRGAAGISGGNPPSAPASLSMRGFSNVLFLYDGLRSSAAGINNRIEDTWNYERIEVLKGPASVLNGDTAIGGIVNVVSRQPERDSTRREAMLSYGSHGAARAAIDLGGALGDDSAYRLDYSHNETKLGTVPRAGQQIDHLTGAVEFGLGRDIRATLSIDYLKDDNQGYFGTPLVPAALATNPTSVVNTPDGRVLDLRFAANNYNVLDDQNSSETYWVRFKLNGKLASGWQWQNELALNKAQRLFKNSESAVFSAPDTMVRDQTLITHSQRYAFDRFNLSRQGEIGGLSNRLVVGAEFGKTSFDSERRFSNGSASTIAALATSALAPQTGYYNPSLALSTGAGNRVDTSTDIDSAALFAEDALKLTPGLTLVGGLRYDRTNLERSLHDLNTASVTHFDTRLNASSARLGAVYELTPASTVYAQYATATVPVSTLFLYSASNTAFKQSQGKQAEVGVKQSTADARLSWTAALYRIELDNVLSRDPNNSTLTVNNGKQSSQGVELTAVWRARRQWTLSSNAALLHARFDNLIEAGGVSRIGNVPTNVPQQVYNLFSMWRPEALPAEVFVGVNHTGRSYTDTANQIRINGRTTADAGVTYRIGKTALSLRVRNLTDKLYAEYGGRASTQVLLAPLRTFELAAKVDF